MTELSPFNSVELSSHEEEVFIAIFRLQTMNNDNPVQKQRIDKEIKKLNPLESKFALLHLLKKGMVQQTSRKVGYDLMEPCYSISNEGAEWALQNESKFHLDNSENIPF